MCLTRLHNQSFVLNVAVHSLCPSVNNSWLCLHTLLVKIHVIGATVGYGVLLFRFE